MYTELAGPEQARQDEYYRCLTWTGTLNAGAGLG